MQASHTDSELRVLAAGGDIAAFQALYDRHWKAVYRFTWLLTGSIPDAEDITQECFLALLRRPASFNPACAQLRTGLIAIARNQHLQRRRNLAHEAGRRILKTLESPGVWRSKSFELTDIAWPCGSNPAQSKPGCTELANNCGSC